MKKHVPLTLHTNRVRVGEYASDESYGMAGAFKLISPRAELMLVMSSGIDDGTGWEHVSASCRDRTPTWDEMCFVKNIFWDEHEMVVQYHPPRSEYVDFHPNCLHLWKSATMPIPMPPALLVGPKR